LNISCSASELSLGSTREIAAIVFNRTPTLASRIALTDELFRARFHKDPGEHDHPILRDWQRLHSDIGRLIAIRNQVAHRPVNEIVEFTPDASGNEVLSDPNWLHMHAAEHERLHRKINDRITASDLSAHIEAVEGIWGSLYELYRRAHKALST
jgi:hypothetical protein